MKEQICLIAKDVDILKKQVAELQGGSPEPEEYPLYAQPTGAHDAYKTGDKVTYQGKRYIRQMDNCVWDPETYPNAWTAVE